MKVLLVNGSPHKNGSTAEALKTVEASLNSCGIETETVLVGDKTIKGCQGCAKCSKRTKGECITDDIVNEVYKRVDEFDGFIFASPVHYASADGAICAFMDRLFYASSDRFFYKPAAAVVCCRRGGGTTAFDRINKYFQISNMPVVSSKYWCVVHGSSAEDVRKDLEGMQILRTLGKNMAWLLKCIEAGKNAGVEKPESEEPCVTNFIR